MSGRNKTKFERFFLMGGRARIDGQPKFRTDPNFTKTQNAWWVLGWEHQDERMAKSFEQRKRENAIDRKKYRFRNAMSAPDSPSDSAGRLKYDLSPGCSEELQQGEGPEPEGGGGMNPKNLEGKTRVQQKSLYEVELIADFEMEYGSPDNWSKEVEDDFNKKWDAIQVQFEGGKL